jgi:hypothetical protein
MFYVGVSGYKEGLNSFYIALKFISPKAIHTLNNSESSIY